MKNVLTKRNINLKKRRFQHFLKQHKIILLEYHHQFRYIEAIEGFHTKTNSYLNSLKHWWQCTGIILSWVEKIGGSLYSDYGDKDIQFEKLDNVKIQTPN